MSNDQPVIVIGGPTASGKSGLALALARRLGGEIVNADSMQVYQGMDIGTAKPTPEEQQLIPHHLIDIRRPDQVFSLAEFLELAGQAITDIRGRGRLPLVVGGSGQYVRALSQGWRAPAVAATPQVRLRLEAEAESLGGEAMWQRLHREDPQAAAAIDARNLRRVVRALEVIEVTGQPFSAQRRAEPPPFPMLSLAIDWPREQLYRRIDERVDAMFAQGLVGEVERLNRDGYGCHLPALNSIGYAQVCSYLAGALTLDEAIARTKTGTHRLARSQGAWFRRGDSTIHWLSGSAAGLAEQAATILARNGIGN